MPPSSPRTGTTKAAKRSKPAPTATRTTQARKGPKGAASKTRAARKESIGTSAALKVPPALRAVPGPDAAELDTLRKELAAARANLDAARRELSDVISTCREAETRTAAARADADTIRRTVADMDATAAAARGTAEAAQAEVGRAADRVEQFEARLAKAREWLAATRTEFAVLGEEARLTLDNFRVAMEAARAGRPLPATAPEPVTEPADLPEIAELAPDDRADDLRDRLVHLLSDAWAVEKEQASLLQALADECGDRELRVLFEAHRADAQDRQSSLEARLEVLGAQPTSGRGVLGQIMTRIWDAVQAPRDQSDKALLSVTKAVGAAEFQAGLYAAAHACARYAADSDTATLATDFFRQVRARASQLRAALVPTVGRAARR